MKLISRYSRFHNTPLVVDDLGNTRYTEWKPPFYGDVPEFIYVVDAKDIDRPDLISYRLFNTVELWWLVLDYNKITDPYTLQIGQKLKIPSVDVIKSKLDSSVGDPVFTEINPKEDFTVKRLLRRRILPFNRPPSITSATTATSLFLFNFAFPVPEALSGLVHFQIQIATSEDFSVLTSSKMTQTSTAGWFYYDPTALNGAGSYKPFPTSGISGATFSSQTVYYKVTQPDLGAASSPEYFFRYRAWQNNTGGPWFVSPPLVIAP